MIPRGVLPHVGGLIGFVGSVAALEVGGPAAAAGFIIGLLVGALWAGYIAIRATRQP